ncbi:sphingomyelin catabolic process [Halocaridina rubra]|uniref:Sphingomyelin catabolic process n=1 Tax=Halocaridina rubra TaxID=373956 RepID=A0AAN8ZW00_HALRR
MGHIPPGSFERYQQKKEGFHWYQDRYNERFVKLIQDNADVIEAQFFAHHHTDSFRYLVLTAFNLQKQPPYHIFP